MNRQISIVTSRCQASQDESDAAVPSEAPYVPERKVLLPTPTGDGDRGSRRELRPEDKKEDCETIGKPVLSPDECGFYIVTPQGFRIDVVANGGFRIYHYSSRTAVYFAADGDEIAVISSHGRVHRFKDVITGLVGDKIVKMSPRGVTFTAKGKPIVYLVDAAGCKSTTDKFKYLSGDITSEILLRRRDLGAKGRELVQELLKNVSTSESDTYLQRWHIADLVFSVSPTERITVCKPDSRFFASIDPDGGVKVKVDRVTLILRHQFSSFVKFSSDNAFFAEDKTSVEQSAKIENSRLTAKCAFQRATLDEKNQLVLCSFK